MGAVALPLLPQPTSELGGVGELAEGVIAECTEEHVLLFWIKKVK
jgi:hypothetical protein